MENETLNRLDFDIIVVGGGHAGLEAVWMATQYDLKVALLSMSNVGLGSAPCNPAIGGVGKGQVVREIDALGGLMGRLADLSGIQYRTLNSSKGYAVQSTRVQIDKVLYSQQAERLIKKRKNLTVIKEKVIKIQKAKREGCFLIETDSKRTLASKKLVVTTGTFLGGKLHSGEEKKSGGRLGKDSSPGLTDLFEHIETLALQFKTGTPPRILKSSINFEKLAEQSSEQETLNFHYKNWGNKKICPQHSCFIAHTNAKTMEIIRTNKLKSPLFNGQIKGVGPRYCPSIEDKANRYITRNQHHIFIEPESSSLETFYPNGLSTALPLDIQEKFLRTIEGLERAEIVVPGYAVEYDVVSTAKLSETLEYIEFPGLYFAGQVNGTSGYEEAAGQGLVAGVNAALSILGEDPFTLSRWDSYIGVMIHDLVTNLRDEPYRLFTARNENRLSVREDNTFLRMISYRKKMKLKEELDFFHRNFFAEFNILNDLCKNFNFSGKEKDQRNLKILTDKSLSYYLKQSVVEPISALSSQCEFFEGKFMKEVIRTVAISQRYEGFVQRACEQNEKLRRLDEKRINWEQLSLSTNLSNECRERISKVKPSSFGQLRNIEGIRPATLSFVAGGL